METVGVVHDFQEQLEYSSQLSLEPSWIAFYRCLWPELIMAVRVDKYSTLQKWGVDREIYLPHGKRITVDEKKRKKDWGDLLVEEWSVGHKVNGDYIGEKIGWSLDREKRCDFVAYAVPSAGKCFMLPFEITRLTCQYNLARWKTLTSNGVSAYPKYAVNRGYLTCNCAVEWPEFKVCFNRQMSRRFGSDLELPPCEKAQDGEQLVFKWGDLG